MYTHDIDYVIRTLGVGATYRGYRYLSYGIELMSGQTRNICFAIVNALSGDCQKV